MMNVLITGAGGQLATALRDILDSEYPDIAYTALSHADLDITDARVVENVFADGNFTHVVNCAAYTAVDRAESEAALCKAINIDGAVNLARSASAHNCKLLHLSTDYVFDGTANRPYRESDKTAPLSVYGNSKRKGETALLAIDPEAIIIRTGWLFAPWGHNFVRTIVRLLKERKHIDVIHDNIGTPTYAPDLARAIITILRHQKWSEGIYNFSNEGTASWYDLAMAIAEYTGNTGCDIRPVSASDYPSDAQRPCYSVLSKEKIKVTFNIKIPYWRNSLRQCLQIIDNG